MTISDLDTPVLLIDIDVMEANLQRMANYCGQQGLDLRPHTKTHKIPDLASRQIQLGAVGITVAKVSEAEVMTEAGIKDILIAYPIYGATKWTRLAHLAGRASITVALDSFEIARGISEYAQQSGVTIGIRVEFDTGFHHCGLPIERRSMDVVERIRDLPGLRWNGIQVYPGHIMGAESSRGVLIARENEAMRELLDLLAERRIECPAVSGGNTPAGYRSHEFIGVTEIRPGTYIFNDKNTVCAEAVQYSDCAATMLTTVVSTSVRGKAIVDAGSKAFSADSLLSGDRCGYGHVPEDPGIVVEDLSEEHGHLDLQHATHHWSVGDRLRIIPNHICTCINLNERAFGIRDEQVVTEWRIAGRGKLT